MSALRHIADVLQGKARPGQRRSSDWPRVRAEHLSQQPECAVCGGREKLEVHHLQPFHLQPELELDPANLITLCEAKRSGANCHLLFGHLGNFRSFNRDARADALRWRTKLASRP
jgi:5-methylcytosine-specific restriction protein A